MKIIEKIEIKHFRSFLGTPRAFETTICDLNEINVFSGSNDSGKSNLLKALNLFFNNEISHGIPFEFDRDFFIGKKNAGHKVIEITISFDLSKDSKRDKFLPEKFNISKYYNRNGFRNYIYSFNIKEKGVIKVDSRAENNKGIKELFLTGKPTAAERKNAEKREWNYRVKFAGFLNKSIAFEYVPAIRDKNYFAQLSGRVISRLKNNEQIEIEDLRREREKIINWESTIKNKTESDVFKLDIQDKKWRDKRINEINSKEEKIGKLAHAIRELEREINDYSSRLMKSIDFLDSEFQIGKNLQDFFEGFDIGTGSEKAISLKLRGDGIQAKYVPKILDFLASIDKEKKYTVWGFEEPENSSEYINQKQLAKEIKEIYSRGKQIFVTTHSEEYLQLYDGVEIRKDERRSNLYHVKKLRDTEYGEYTEIYYFDVDKNEFEITNQKAQLDEDLGQSYLRAKYSKEITQREEEYLKDKTAILTENTELKKKVQQKVKPIIFVEDAYTELYKIVWLILNKISFTDTTFIDAFDREAPFLIHSTKGASGLAGFLRAQGIDYWKDKKVLGVFDFDEEGRMQFNCLKNESYWNTNNEGNKKEGIFRKRVGHNCFCAMLIPIPTRLDNIADLGYPSYVEIENLLPVKFLQDHKFVKEMDTTGNTKYFKIQDSCKSTAWKEVAKLTEAELEDFKPFFSRINEIFGLS